MLALDTNVLVRFLVEDDEAQSARAAKLVARAVRQGDQLFVADVVLCETVWVLRASYELGRDEIADVLQRLLKAAHLTFADSDALKRSAEAFARGKGDFADYVIREQARAAGCDHVATFDRALLKEQHFTAP
jgi:predicted nucleic-acid-binding protein